MVVLERPGGLRALGRSRELVRGNAWNVFAVILLLVILVGVVAVVIEAAATPPAPAVGLVVRVVVGILTAPISALARRCCTSTCAERTRGRATRGAAARPGSRRAGPARGAVS